MWYICFIHSQQHGSDHYTKQWKEGLNKEISWNYTRDRNHGWYSTATLEYHKTSRSYKYTISRDWNYYLQASGKYKTQIVENIFSILEDLWNIIQRDIKNQAYHI